MQSPGRIGDRSPGPGYAMDEVIRRGFIRIAALDVTL